MAFARRPRSWRRFLLVTAVVVGALLVLAQAVPYGRTLSNPPVTKEPAWDSQATRALAVHACFDCHSNQTTHYWYSKIAPISWLIANDVNGGRSQFNFSEWDKPQDVSAGDMAETIRGGGMPPWFYSMIHGTARLSSSEKDALVRGLEATLARSPPPGGGGGG